MTTADQFKNLTGSDLGVGDILRARSDRSWINEQLIPGAEYEVVIPEQKTWVLYFPFH